MVNSDVIIFGCDEYALQLAENLNGYCRSLKIFSREKEGIGAIEARGFEVELFDVSDDWESLKEYNPKELIAYSAVCNEADNIFLTISLRTTFKDIAIFALATDRQNAIKLRAAGANKTIVTAQIAANTITEMLEKPTASDMIQRLLHDTGDVQVAQIVLSKRCDIVGKRVRDINFEVDYDVIVVAVIDKEFQSMFTFTKKGANYQMEGGDILVAVGHKEKISDFEKKIGKHLLPDWHHWRR